MLFFGSFSTFTFILFTRFIYKNLVTLKSQSMSNVKKNVACNVYLYYTDFQLPSKNFCFLLKSMEHNCIYGVLCAFCFSVLHSTSFYHILLVSLELNRLKKYFLKFVKLYDFYQKQPKGFEKNSDFSINFENKKIFFLVSEFFEISCKPEFFSTKSSP